MSIRDAIKREVHLGRLHPLLPGRRSDPIRRAMFVSNDLWNVLRSPEGDDEWEIRVARLEATLERFVIGDTIDPKYLFLLHPKRDCVWEIRCTRDDPSIRVLGLFAEKDVFIATHHALRSDLGAWESRAWRDTKVRAKTEWGHLCNTYRPMTSHKVEELVTGAVSGKYFRNPPHQSA